MTPSGGLAAHGEVGKAALNSMKVVYQNSSSGGFTSHVVQKVTSAAVVTRQPQQQQQQQRHSGLLENYSNYNSDNDLPIKKVSFT